MDAVYIAINGDNVGEGIGNAIASDNHENLEKITGGLEGAHNSIKEWVESVGGKIVTQSGDEGIYQIPSEAYSEDEIDKIREMYSEQTGTTVTIGVGESMSEASKALIYGKLNDKDQVVEYDSHVDDYISSHEDEEEMEDSELEDEEVKEPTDEDAELEDFEAEEGQNLSNNNLETGGDQDSIAENDEKAINGESANEETDETQDDLGLDDEVEEPSDEDEIEEEEDDKIEMDADDLVDEHEDLVDTLESPSHEDDLEEAKEQQEELDEYKEIADEDQEPEEKISEMVDDDEDTTSIEVPKNEVDGDYGSEEMAEAQPEHEKEMDEDEEFIHDAQENREDELDDDMIEADEESGRDSQQQHNMISDMIHANMEEGGQDNSELKQKIMQSLQSFKQNKPIIEQAKQADPEFYGSIMNMLQSMIEMAKQLNMNPEQDLENQNIEEELPYADQEDVEKSENWREYYARKDAEKKAKKAASKKRINGKKPLDHALDEIKAKMDKENKENKEKKKEKK